jgi:GntR family transcriptional regulator
MDRTDHSIESTIDEHLDQNSYVPLYKQLFMLLKKSIERGNYKADEQLPSERELMDKYSVSRITVIAATQELVRSGMAYRIRGKGTFVAAPKIQGHASFGSFSADIRQRGMVPLSKVIEFSTLPASEEAQQHLNLQPDDLCYYFIRIRHADGEPVAVEYAWLPANLYPNLEEVDLDQESLFEVMERRYNLFPTWADGFFEAAAATKEEAELLNISPNAPVLWVHRVTTDKNYLPLEWVHSMYRADRFSFSTGRQSIRD